MIKDSELLAEIISGSYLEYEVTLHQFTQILRNIWNLDQKDPIIGDEKSERDRSKAFWRWIASSEASRYFAPDWGFCSSTLEITANGVRRWTYETTSKTVFHAEQTNQLFVDEDEHEYQLSPGSFFIFLPKSREDGFHHGVIQLYLDNPEHKYYSWGEKHWAEPGTPQYEAAKLEDFTPLCDEPWEELPYSEKKQRDPERFAIEEQQKALDLDGDDDYDEDGADDYEEDLFS